MTSAGVISSCFGDLVGSRLALVLLFEIRIHLADLVQRADAVQRQTDDARLFGQRLQDRLADPPYGIRDELVAAGFVEPLGGLDQTEVALVDQVAERESLILILLGHTDDEAQIGLGQLFEGKLVAAADAAGQLNLFIRGEEGNLADFLKVFFQASDLPGYSLFS